MATTYTDMNRDRDVARDETTTLISSDTVEGTAVYGNDGDKIGRIENVMIEKRSGQVAYAVLSFGGFLGIGTDHYPLPWSMLRYDDGLGGYLVDLTREQIESAPRYREDESSDWAPSMRSQVDAYYRPIAMI